MEIITSHCGLKGVWGCRPRLKALRLSDNLYNIYLVLANLFPSYDNILDQSQSFG